MKGISKPIEYLKLVYELTAAECRDSRDHSQPSDPASERLTTGRLCYLVPGLAIKTGYRRGLIEHHYNTPDLPNIHYVNPANCPRRTCRPSSLRLQ